MRGDEVPFSYPPLFSAFKLTAPTLPAVHVSSSTSTNHPLSLLVVYVPRWV